MSESERKLIDIFGLMESQERGCIRGTGGAVMGDSGWVRLVGSHILENRIRGSGSGQGGGLSAILTSEMAISDSRVCNNFALEGYFRPTIKSYIPVSIRDVEK